MGQLPILPQELAANGEAARHAEVRTPAVGLGKAMVVRVRRVGRRGKVNDAVPDKELSKWLEATEAGHNARPSAVEILVGHAAARAKRAKVERWIEPAQHPAHVQIETEGAAAIPPRAPKVRARVSRKNVGLHAHPLLRRGAALRLNNSAGKQGNTGQQRKWKQRSHAGVTWIGGNPQPGKFFPEEIYAGMDAIYGRGEAAKGTNLCIYIALEDTVRRSSVCRGHGAGC